MPGVTPTIMNRFKINDVRSLFNDAKKASNYLVACILQTDVKNASNFTEKAGKTIMAQATGAGVTGGILALVATYGTAGTGTAIGSLSGAAATSATLAWVGGIVGGGMAAGAVLTGGLAVAVSYGAYKMMSSTTREYADLEPTERNVVDRAIVIIRYVDEATTDVRMPDDSELETLNSQLMQPLQNILNENEKYISNRLDIKNSIAFKQRCLPMFDKFKSNSSFHLLSEYRV